MYENIKGMKPLQRKKIVAVACLRKYDKAIVGKIVVGKTLLVLSTHDDYHGRNPLVRPTDLLAASD